MYAWLTFNMDDKYEREDHLRCLKSSDLCHVLWNILHDRETQVRMGLTEDQISKLSMYVYDEGIDLDEMYS